MPTRQRARPHKSKSCQGNSQVFRKLTVTSARNVVSALAVSKKAVILPNTSGFVRCIIRLKSTTRMKMTFLFTWLKKQGIDDALIQPYSGHESRQSLEIYSKLSLADAQQEYDQVMGHFPIQ